MKYNLFEAGDIVETPSGDGFVDEDQKKGDIAVRVNLIDVDEYDNFDPEDLHLKVSIS